jgi:hypothetical protein
MMDDLGLWLPASLVSRFNPELRSGPRLRWVCRLSDQPGVTVSAGDFWDRIQSVNPVAAIRALAGVNVGLALGTMGASVQPSATHRYVRPELLPLAAPFGQYQTPGAFFARSGTLVAIKSLIAAAPAESALRHPDPHTIGDLSLDANELAFPDLSAGDDLDIAAHFLPAWDVYNRPILGYGLARAYQMLELLWEPMKS